MTEGGCNCGAIRYRVAGQALTCYICHCHRCQKRTGSAFSLSMVYVADAIELTQGQPVFEERQLPDGAVAIAATCAACHSRIWRKRSGRRTLSLRAGTLDETRNLRPVAQLWTSSAQAWAIVPGILSYEIQPDDPAPLLAAWAQANQEWQGARA